MRRARREEVARGGTREEWAEGAGEDSRTRGRLEGRELGEAGGEWLLTSCTLHLEPTSLAGREKLPGDASRLPWGDRSDADEQRTTKLRIFGGSVPLCGRMGVSQGAEYAQLQLLPTGSARESAVETSQSQSPNFHLMTHA